MHRSFPDGFLWGAGTSAHQVEGGLENDWTRWERANAERLAAEAPARYGDSPVWRDVRDAATTPANYRSGRGVEHYDRYGADVDLAADLGHTAHRFSVPWSRVEPEPGTYDEDALAHYRRVCDTLRDRGLAPVVTLWHFTNPTWFADAGGWTNPDLDRWRAYVDRVVDALGDRVAYWVTVNEPEVYAAMGYLAGEWPPDRRNPLAYFRVRRNLVRAHRRAYDAIHRQLPDADVGIATNVTHYDPAGGLPNRLAARLARRVLTHYELDRIGGKQDFVGLNHYFHRQVRYGLHSGTDVRSDLGWGVNPESIYHVLRTVGAYNLPVLVTENGIADRKDRLRPWFIRRSLHHVGRAMDDGVDVAGYLHWSLLDNFEWAEGYWPRFGLVAVDRDTMEREPRESARAYARMIDRGGLAERPGERPE